MQEWGGRSKPSQKEILFFVLFFPLGKNSLIGRVADGFIVSLELVIGSSLEI